MKRFIKFIKKYLGEVMVIIGSGLFAYNIFNFSYYGKGWMRVGAGVPRMPRIGGGGMAYDPSELEGIAYYYHSNTLLWIAIAAMLIVAGILIIRNRKQS